MSDERISELEAKIKELEENSNVKIVRVWQKRVDELEKKLQLYEERRAE